MRFRYIQLQDIPEVGKLYTQLLEDKREEELNYPITGPQDANDFMLSITKQLIANPSWFAIVGVVGSKLTEDHQGVKHVVGGKCKALIAVSMTERSVGYPKQIGFVELLVVDREFRKRDIGRKLIHTMAVEASQRGAQVLECAWNPGSLGEQLWTDAGVKPYRTLGAWILDDGTPRSDLPLAKPAEPTEPPKRKPGRPRKPTPTDEGT